MVACFRNVTVNPACGVLIQVCPKTTSDLPSPGGGLIKKKKQKSQGRFLWRLVVREAYRMQWDQKC